MNALELMEAFSSDIYPVVYSKNRLEKIYILDSYHFDDPDNNYGIYNELFFDDFIDGEITLEDIIPDMYTSNAFCFDTLKEECLNSADSRKINDKELQKLYDRVLTQTSIYRWPKILQEEMGIDLSARYKEMCYSTDENYEMTPIPDQELKYANFTPDDREEKIVREYIAEMEEIEHMYD